MVMVNCCDSGADRIGGDGGGNREYDGVLEFCH